MPSSRRLVVLLVAVLLMALPALAQAQGGAGDDQYQDPFGPGTTQTDRPASSGDGDTGQDRSSSAGDSAGTDAPAAGSGPPLTQDPGLESSPASEAPTPAATTDAQAPAAGDLPRTGSDAPVVALLGVGLLAAGVGLRLRLRVVDGSRP